MSELEVPTAAIRAAARAAYIDLAIYTSAPIEAALEAAAPIIVAAELRRLTVPYGEREDVCAGDRDRLLARADELDPPEVTP